jgi:hypothetical protein
MLQSGFFLSSRSAGPSAGDYLAREGRGAIRDSVGWGAHAFLRRLVAIVVWSAAGCSFLLRPPNTGKSNDGWRRSGILLVRFSLIALPPFADAPFARLRFKAAIRSTTGGGSLIGRGLILAADYPVVPG